jgi:hypothetical protein
MLTHLPTSGHGSMHRAPAHYVAQIKGHGPTAQSMFPVLTLP